MNCCKGRWQLAPTRPKSWMFPRSWGSPPATSCGTVVDSPEELGKPSSYLMWDSSGFFLRSWGSPPATSCGTVVDFPEELGKPSSYLMWDHGHVSSPEAEGRCYRLLSGLNILYHKFCRIIWFSCSINK